MTGKDEFSEAIEAGSGSGETWKPDEQAVIFGTYKGSKSNVGPNNSMVYLIREDGKDEDTSVWGSTVLDGRFEEVPVGSRVKIEYLGMEKGKRATYKNYKVVYVKPKVDQAVADTFPGAEAVADPDVDA